MLGAKCEINKVPSGLDVGLERHKRQIEVKAPSIVDDNGHRLSDLGVRLSMVNTASVERSHTSTYSSGEKPQLSRDASASTYTSFLELNKSTERPLSTNAELYRSSIEDDEDVLLHAYTLSTPGFSKSCESKNDPRPPVDPVSSTTAPVGCETMPFIMPLTTGNAANLDRPTEYFSSMAFIIETRRRFVSKPKPCDIPRSTRWAIQAARS